MQGQGSPASWWYPMHRSSGHRHDGRSEPSAVDCEKLLVNNAIPFLDLGDVGVATGVAFFVP